MPGEVPFAIGGYVLAGGRSSRMGRDKALIELAGKPLIEHAVTKLRRMCRSVYVLGANPALAKYGPLVSDLHPDCGPIGGFEAALAHSLYEWNVFLAVDMPFLPAAFIRMWVARWVEQEMEQNLGPEIRVVSVDGRAQPGFCLIHKDVGPLLTQAIERREFKLMRAFEMADEELRKRHGAPTLALWDISESVGEGLGYADLAGITTAQRAAQALWFANLNTAEDLAEAGRNIEALDD